MVDSSLLLRPTPGSARSIAVAFCFLLCLSFFVERGPYRALRESRAYDFSTLYAAARCWTAGEDPYLVTNLKEQLTQARAPDSLIRQQDVNPCLYFLSAMPLVASIAWLRWSVATVVWCVLSLAFFAASLLVTFRQVRLSVHSRWICCSLSLLFCPAYAGMLYENPSVLACSLVALIVFLPHAWYRTRGILLALALGLKPQIGMVALCALVLWRLWAPLLIGFVFSALVTLAGIVRAGSFAQFTAWSHSQQANFALLTLPGGKGDLGPDSPWALGSLNAQTISALFVRNVHIQDVIVWTFAAALLALYLVSRRVRLGCRNRDLVFFTAWTTTAVYHRYYDAQLFLVLWPALIELWQGLHRKVTMALGGCLCFLVLPSENLIARLLHSEGAVHSGLDVLLFRHQSIAVILMALVALCYWPAENNGSPGSPTKQKPGRRTCRASAFHLIQLRRGLLRGFAAQAG